MHSFVLLLIIYVPCLQKMCLRDICEQHRSRLRKTHNLIRAFCFTLIYSSASTDFVSGQRRPRSACADAQADLGLCCPPTPRKHISHGTAYTFILVLETAERKELEDLCHNVQFVLHELGQNLKLKFKTSEFKYPYIGIF